MCVIWKFCGLWIPAKIFIKLIIISLYLQVQAVIVSDQNKKVSYFVGASIQKISLDSAYSAAGHWFHYLSGEVVFI